MRAPPTILLALMAAVATVLPARATAGALDPKFSGDGIAVTFPHGSVGTAVAVDHAGRSVVVGYTLDGTVDVAVARFLPDGTLDGTFGGGDGRVRIDVGRADYGFDVAVASDDGLAIAGERSGASGSVGFVLRLGPRGVPMSSFGGGDGVVLLDLGKAYQGVNAIAFTPKGRIVAGGYTSNGSLSRCALVRLLADGRYDTGFSDDGRFTVDLSPGAEQVNDLLVLDDGRIVAGGYAESGIEPVFALVRVLGSGTLDTTFGGGDGSTLTDLAPGADEARGLALTKDGHLVLAGSAEDGGKDAWGVVRYGFAGKPDATFGTNGVVLLPFSDGRDEGTDVVATGTRLLVVGDIAEDLGVVRLKPDGSKDLSFGGGDGIARVDVAGDTDEARGGALQSNGKIVVAGSSRSGTTYRVVVARLLTA